MKDRIDHMIKGCAVAIAVIAFMLTFTISDYYIFNRFAEYGILFCISQWVKKSGLLLILIAVFYRKKSCADIAKYVLPVFVILSCFLFGNFFDITKTATTEQQAIYNSINLFFPKRLNIILFFLQNALYIVVCILLFLRDGYKVEIRSFIYLIPSIVLCMPLNIFENFFDINDIPSDSFLRFKSFSIWHLVAIILLIVTTVFLYNFLKGKSKETQHAYLGAIAIILLIQYHSKDSVVMGDGYNVYHTLFSCIPLFICNIGVYTTSLAVFTRKKVLYAISFFVHAAGAVSVFVYFGKDSLSNYGIFCSYSIAYFTFTHALLFALCILPTLLKMYKFTIKDCIIPLIYYFIVIILASVCSALVTSASTTWHTSDGYYLSESGLLMPNYAFTQINPLPFEVPELITLTIWKYNVNVLYVVGLYIAYVLMFFAFTGIYYAVLAIRKKVFNKVNGELQASAEIAITSTNTNQDMAHNSNDTN